MSKVRANINMKSNAKMRTTTRRRDVYQNKDRIERGKRIDMNLKYVIYELRGIQSNITDRVYDPQECCNNIEKAIGNIERVIEEEESTLSQRVDEILEAGSQEGHIPKNDIQVQLWFEDKFRKRGIR